MSDTVRWLTYDEIAAEMSIERESARQLAIRKRWARQRGNDGKARVGVPEEELQARTGDGTSQSPSDDPSDNTGDETSVIHVLTRHIRRLEAEIEALKEDRAADKSERDVERDRLLSEITAHKQDLDAERLIASQVGTLRTVIDDLKSERDRWANAAEASQQQLDRVIQASKVEQHRGWWPFRKRA